MKTPHIRKKTARKTSIAPHLGKKNHYFTMNDCRVVSQNHRFVIMLGGAGVIHPALHKARSCAVG